MKKTEFTSIHIIFNPNSTGDSQSLAKDLARKLRKQLPKATIQTVATTHAGHAKDLAKGFATDYSRPLIVSSSGDGGYNEVVNGIMEAGNKQAISAVLPAGNANDHSRTMQKQPLLEAIIAGKVTSIDLLELTIQLPGQAKQTQYAHSYIGLGLTPVVATELNKQSLNAIREAAIIFRTFFKYRPFIIVHAGKRIRLDSLLFANINQMAKVLTLSAHNRPADGKFEIILFPAGRKWQLVKRLARAAATQLDDVKQTKTYQFTVIKTLPTQLDGEVMRLPKGARVKVSSAHKVLKTIV